MESVIDKSDISHSIEELRRLKLRLAETREQRLRYEADNRIEFFGLVNEERGFKGPNPLQKKLLEAWDNPHYKLFTYTGGNRIGKTTIGIIIGLSTLFGKWLWNGRDLIIPHHYPRKVRLIGQDWEKHIKAVLEPELHKWWPKNRAVRIKKNNFGAESFWVDEKTGSSLEIMSNKQESELHEGWSGDLILYDEPPRREIRIANARGLIDRQGRELFCMTLLKEAWVDRDVIKAVNQDGTPDTTVFNVHGDISANIGFGITQMGVEQFAKTLTEEEKDARLKGIPSYMSGLIYSKFNRQTHLRKRFKIPLDWLVDISIDFHPSKKWAVLFVATDKRNFKYCIDEIHENGSWKAISEEIVRRIKTNHYRVEAPIIIDPLAKGDEQSDLNEESVFEKMQNLFAAYGLRMSAASKDKDGGIHLVKDLLMTENEMPSLFFFNDLKQTIKELEGYMIDPDTNKPQKYDDDFMECLYRIALLNTQWYNMADDEIFTYKHEVETRNAVTGY